MHIVQAIAHPSYLFAAIPAGPGDIRVIDAVEPVANGIDIRIEHANQAGAMGVHDAADFDPVFLACHDIMHFVHGEPGIQLR